MGKAAAKKVKFGQVLAAGGTQKQAAVAAGYKPADGAASRRAKDPIVVAEIARLQAADADKALKLRAEAFAYLGQVLGLAFTQYTTLDKDGVPKIDAAKAKKAGLGKLLHFRVKKKQLGSGEDASVIDEIEAVVPDKLEAIEKAAKLFGWYKPEKIDVTTKPADLQDLSDEELAAALAANAKVKMQNAK